MGAIALEGPGFGLTALKARGPEPGRLADRRSWPILESDFSDPAAKIRQMVPLPQRQAGVVSIHVDIEDRLEA